MSIDVLQVNRNRACSVALSANQVAQEANAAFLSTLSGEVKIGSAWANSSLWSSYIPAAPTGGTALCVYDATTTFRCGGCCLWTVPAGVTRARFEIWGAGGGSPPPGCCCAITPFGATGAYAVVCMPVVAGCQYTLCAGCAFCCFPRFAAAGCHGCASYVSGAGLCNFCAMGGTRGSIPCYYREGAHLGSGCFITCCKFQWEKIGTICEAQEQPATNPGANICGVGETCVGTSQCSVGIFPTRPSWCRTFYGTACNIGTAASIDIFGVPSLYGEVCFTGGICCGWIKHPPIPQFENVSQCCEIVCETRGSFGVCGCSTVANSSFRTQPGAGGHGGALYGGCNAGTRTYGDTGRTGMVRVIYC